MRWSVELSRDAARVLRKLDPQTSRRIRRALKAIESLDDPRARGKALTGRLAGLWRYRVGDYRLVCDLVDSRLVVVVIEVGHRSHVYDY
ncbi:type II toxin-antitoxin system RelE family toxin [Corynebacterium mastitidis]|uniref:Type II toxin-antitoxin system mRNA interferase toxin, RelE/StbE family n=1 Tax=Corynebacterium mastitidis TaxID=161890 RepID=A0A2N0X726_9CORY|nr:type II toxin-antitoxin system RelE/ParE family toxin [Corynebacterium mastitidis]PKF68497.1 type II toxin-antitoxin system mRNA interferase toxin, RelE/StbE family [Corynebacterium mastitidis]